MFKAVGRFNRICKSCASLKLFDKDQLPVFDLGPGPGEIDEARNSNPDQEF